MPFRPFSCPSPHLRLLLQGLQATLRRRGVACHVVHFLPWYHQVVSTRTKQLGRRPFWREICTWEIGEAFSFIIDILDIFRYPFIILGYQNHADMLGIQNHGSRFFLNKNLPTSGLSQRYCEVSAAPRASSAKRTQVACASRITRAASSLERS